MQYVCSRVCRLGIRQENRKRRSTNYGMLKAPYYPLYLIVLRFVAPIGIPCYIVNELGLLSW